MEAEAQVGLLDVLRAHAGAGLKLLRLHRATGLGCRAGAPGSSEVFLDLGEGLVAIQITVNHQHDLVGAVVSLVEGQNARAIHPSHRGLGSQHGAPVGMALVGEVEHLARQSPPRLVLAAVDLLDDHLDLALQLDRVEGRVPQGIGEHVEPLREEAGGENQVVDGLIVRGPGVDLAPASLDIPSDLTRRASTGTLEEEMLVKVGQAFLAGAFVGRSDLHPGLQRHHRRGGVLGQYHPKPILELLDH